MSNLITHPSFYNAGDKLSITDVPDCLWPTDNDEGIPVLKLSHQADAVDLPVTMWGTRKRSTTMNGTWGFYVDDYRFSGIWKKPYLVINSGCVNAIEPNFTLHSQMPRAVALWAIYKKRWLARYWQEHGNVRIFVDLNVNGIHEEDNLLGVPKGWRAYATRGYNASIPEYEHTFNLACERAGHDDLLFLIVGGGKAVRDHCKEKNWIWIPENFDKVKERDIAADNKQDDGE